MIDIRKQKKVKDLKQKLNQKEYKHDYSQQPMSSEKLMKKMKFLNTKRKLSNEKV